MQPGYVPWRLPLTRFVRETRRGHCEHFATATALLLRAAGVPARYAVGYVVSEYSALEQAYVVRARHAHAWVEAFVDGRWIDVDTTPAVWYALEAADPPWWRGPLDLWTWARGRHAALREAGASPSTPLLLATAGLLFAVLLWRLRRQLRPGGRRAATARSGAGPRAATAGVAPLLANLARRGVKPAAGESLASFLRRHFADGASDEPLGALIAEHERQRFGPEAPCPPAETRMLARRCRAFLAARGRAARAARVSSGWRALRAACRRNRRSGDPRGSRR